MANMKPYRKRNGLIYDYAFNDLYNMIDSFFNDSPASRTVEATSFKVDIKDEGDKYIIEAEMPGIDKEEIDISVDDNTLSIAVERDEEVDRSEDGEESNYIHRERRTSRMKRSMSFVDMDSDDISAKLDQGILTISLGKEKEEETRKSIEIE